jgi:hypothetical protein
MIENDPVVQRYRAFFALLDWQQVFPASPGSSKAGKPPHPPTAYVKALLVKLCEHHDYITQLRRYLLEHPLLVLELGFHPILDRNKPYGFDVERTLPCDRWLRYQQQTFHHGLLQDLFHATIHALQNEIAGLGEIIAIDVKHLYAWVGQNNPRRMLKDRFTPSNQPHGDPDCKLGVKSSTNLHRADGSVHTLKEYLWGYGSGVVSAITADYGDVILAEHTLTFDQGDVSHFFPLYRQAAATLGFFPTHITADAAFDAWYAYQKAILHGGIAAIPINQHAHPTFTRDPDGTPLCPVGKRMHPTYAFNHTNGYRAQRYRCPLLHPERTEHTCQHEQFKKGKGCVKDINIEKGGLMRVTLDRSAPLYHVIYNQRTSCERINSQAKAQEIERPKVRNRRSVENLNTLIYTILNVKALQRARTINQSLLPIK